MDWRAYAGRHALADFVGMEHEGARMLVRQGYQDAARRVAERGTFAEVETIGGGRERHAVVVLPSGEKAVVRQYRRGGVLRHLNRRLYFGGNRAFDELRATEHARQDGVRAPVVLAAIEVPAAMGYRATLVTLLVPGARDAAGWLADAGTEDRLAALADAGEQIARVHAAGITHPDLNLRNLIVSREGIGSPVVHVLDFDKAVVLPAPLTARRRSGGLRRLARSARKLRVPLGPEAWAAFREGYGDEWPEGLRLGG